MTVIGNGEGTLSRVSSQLSLQPVLEDQHSQMRTDLSSETSTPPTPHHDPSKLTISSGSYHRFVLWFLLYATLFLRALIYVSDFFRCYASGTYLFSISSGDASGTYLFLLVVEIYYAFEMLQKNLLCTVLEYKRIIVSKFNFS